MRIERLKQNIARLPIRAYLSYLVLATFLISGITFSKYITVYEKDDTARVAQIYELDIQESGDFYDGNTMLLIPGVSLEKDAVVEFGGAEFACYIFLRVKATGFTTSDHQHFISNSCMGGITWEMEVGNNAATGWKYLKEEDNAQIYYAVLSPGTAINKEIIKNAEISVDENITRSQLQSAGDLKIAFESYAVQYDGFGDQLESGYSAADHANAAWDRVKRHET